MCGIIEGGWIASLEFLREIVIVLIGAYAGSRMGSPKNLSSGDAGAAS